MISVKAFLVLISLFLSNVLAAANWLICYDFNIHSTFAVTVEISFEDKSFSGSILEKSHVKLKWGNMIVPYGTKYKANGLTVAAKVGLNKGKSLYLGEHSFMCRYVNADDLDKYFNQLPPDVVFNLMESIIGRQNTRVWAFSNTPSFYRKLKIISGKDKCTVNGKDICSHAICDTSNNLCHPAAGVPKGHICKTSKGFLDCENDLVCNPNSGKCEVCIPWANGYCQFK